MAGAAVTSLPLMENVYDLGVTVIGNRYEDPDLLESADPNQ